MTCFLQQTDHLLKSTITSFNCSAVRSRMSSTDFLRFSFCLRIVGHTSP